MRVHPNMLGPRRSRVWGAAALVGLNILILALGFARTGFEVSAPVEKLAPREPSVKVLVLDESLQVGDSLESARVTLKARPMSMLPQGRITSRDVLVDKVAAGPLPAGTILSTLVLADALAQLPVVPKLDRQPVDELLDQLATRTVGIELRTDGTAPARGTRVAITDPSNANAVLVAEAWVSEIRPTGVLVRMDPKKAASLEVKPEGKVAFVELPSSGASPYL